MVTINFTIVVLLAMFLAFLWVMHRYVFSPALALKDRRDESMAGDRAAAREATEEANRLEDEYRARLAEMHREANRYITRTRRKAQEQHNANVEAFRKRAEQELRELRETIHHDIESQKDQFDALAHQAAGAMASHLALE